MSCKIFIYLFILTFTWNTSQTSFRCSNQVKNESPLKFYFVSACSQSKMNIIASRKMSNLASCEQYALRKKGLALNYIHQEFLHRGAGNSSLDTCLVFDCPEFNYQKIEDPSLYDYYSLYARPVPSGNVSCVPGVGVFRLHLEKKNYTQALNTCLEEDGDLADITSDLRTNALSALLVDPKLQQAYVGLTERFISAEFISEKKVPLSCLPFRSWAPGEPKPVKSKKVRCVTISNKNSWKAVPCSKKLPFICELTPSGPLRPCKHLKSRRRRRKCIRKFKSSFPTLDRYPKCGAPVEDNTTVTEVDMDRPKKRKRPRTRQRYHPREEWPRNEYQ